VYTPKEESMSKQIAVSLVALAALAIAVPTTPAARQDTMKPVLVKTIVDKKLGRVLTTPGKRAIYVWNKEPKGKVRCTGACAQAWPPVLVKARVVVPMHVTGIMGEFGTVRRANGVRQLTFNRRALYTYAHEDAGQVLCNNVDSWFAVKVHG
jgi:predicted lipoprotein with Yx(FWY)xxD motif